MCEGKRVLNETRKERNGGWRQWKGGREVEGKWQMEWKEGSGGQEAEKVRGGER